MITLVKNNKLFSFLLRVNDDKTAYLANVLSPQEPGSYQMLITIFDYKNKVLKKIEAELLVKKAEYGSAQLNNKESFFLQAIGKNYYWLIMILAVLVAMAFTIKKIKQYGQTA